MRNFKFLIYLIFVSSVLFISSCTSEEDVTDIEEFQVEIEKRQRQYSDFNPITSDEASSLMYFIDPQCAGTPYANAILDAVQEYNNAEISVFFTQTTVTADAHIFFDCVDQPNSACGEASAFTPLGGLGTDLAPVGNFEFPSGGTIGAEVNLLTNWNDCPCTEAGCNEVGNEPACMFTRTVMHELGHILGLSHNDGSNNFDTQHIEGTPDIDDDPNSIFNSGPITFENCDWCDAPCVFNENDILAIQSLYPCVKPRARIAGPKFLCNIGQEATYCFPNEYTVENWDVPNNMSIVNTNGNCITVVLNSSNGNVPIRVTINNNSCVHEYELNVGTFTERPNFDIDWNDPVCLGDVVTFTIVPLPSGQVLSVTNWTFSDGLSDMNSNERFGVAESLIPGRAKVCATVENRCGREHTYCRFVNINNDSDCRGDGDLPNPK